MEEYLYCPRCGAYSLGALGICVRCGKAPSVAAGRRDLRAKITAALLALWVLALGALPFMYADRIETDAFIAKVVNHRPMPPRDWGPLASLVALTTWRVFEYEGIYVFVLFFSSMLLWGVLLDVPKLLRVAAVTVGLTWPALSLLTETMLALPELTVTLVPILVVLVILVWSGWSEKRRSVREMRQLAAARVAGQRARRARQPKNAKPYLERSAEDGLFSHPQVVRNWWEQGWDAASE